MIQKNNFNNFEKGQKKTVEILHANIRFKLELLKSADKFLCNYNIN